MKTFIVRFLSFSRDDVEWSVTGEQMKDNEMEIDHKLNRVQNDSGAHRASYPRGTTGSFPGGKATGA